MLTDTKFLRICQGSVVIYIVSTTGTYDNALKGPTLVPPY